MKRFLSIFIAFSMLLSVCTGLSFNALALTDGDYEYSVLSDGTVEITGYNGTDIDLYIPSVIAGMAVTAIGDFAFFMNETVTAYYLPSGLKTIGTAAFFQCSMEKIAFPDSLETIGENAFLNCTVLKSVSLGNKISGLTSETFYGCTRVSSFSVSSNNEDYSSADGVLFNKDKTVLMNYPAGSENTSYAVPDGVETVCANAFFNCASLKELTVPASLKTVEENAFDSSSGITDIYYLSTEEDWAEINISETGNSYFTGAAVHYNSKPEPCKNHTKADGDEGTVTKEPTCTENGEKSYICAVCGEAFTEETDPLGHSAQKLAAVSPTYFNTGKTEGKKCSVCGKILTAQKSVNKLVLSVPSKKKATAKKKAFVIKWKKNNNANGYIIQYSLKKNFSKKKTVKVTKNSTVKKTVKKLKSGKKYYIRIRAYKKSGSKTAYSKWSKTVKVKTK